MQEQPGHKQPNPSLRKRSYYCLHNLRNLRISLKGYAVIRQLNSECFLVDRLKKTAAKLPGNFHRCSNDRTLITFSVSSCL